jgi:hypothetical protein
VWRKLAHSDVCEMIAMLIINKDTVAVVWRGTYLYADAFTGGHVGCWRCSQAIECNIQYKHAGAMKI